MKKFFLSLAVVILSVVLLVSGCNKDPHETSAELQISTELFDNVPSEGMTLGLTITTLSDWEISGIPEWIYINTPTGNGTATVDIEVAANDGDARSAQLDVAVGKTVKTVVVNQLAKVVEPSLKVLNAEFMGLPKSENTIVLSVVSALVDWEITDVPEWCSIASEDMKGAGNKDVVITVSENTGENKREATFRLKGNDVPTVGITVSQLGSRMFMPDPTMRANESYYGRIVVIDDNTGEFTLTEKGMSATTVGTYCATTLEGLEHYPNLKTLNLTGDYLQDRNLTEVDVRGIRSLETLFLASCPKVRIIKANGMPNLRKIDVQNSGHPENVAIEELYAQGSSKLDSLGCTNGKLKILDVTDAENLKMLVVPGNPLTEIKGLNTLSRIEELKIYSCDFESIDLSANVNLVQLICRDNKLTELNLNKNIRLNYLSCADNKIPDLSHSIRNLVHLQTLICYNTGMKELDLSPFTELRYLQVYGNEIESLDCSGKKELYYLDCFDMPSLESLNISGCNNLVLVGLTHESAVSADAHSAYDQRTGVFDLGSWQGVTPAFKEFKADGCNHIIEFLSIDNSNIERISLQNCTNMETLTIRGNANLRYLDITGTKIRNYDVTGTHPEFEVVGK